MRPKERIPLHDHVDRNSGGRIERTQVTAAVSGLVTSIGGEPHTLDGPQHLAATGTAVLLATTAHSGLLAPLSGTATEFLDGTGAFSTPAAGNLPWFNVQDYGAVGDGTTDDTAAINTAIATINTAGCGVLYFPCGTYLVTGALTAITAECTILGDLQGMQDGSATVSRINCSSQTAVLFTISARLARFEKLHLVNTFAGNASAGAAVLCLGPDFRQKVDFDAVTITDFYIGVDVQRGEAWVMNNTYIEDCVLYDLKIRNTDVADVGDWKLTNSVFGQNDRACTAAIRIESSGGGKIVNCKINSGTNHHQYGIQLVPASVTSILLISNSSFENTSSNALRLEAGSAAWPYIIISGNQFGMYQTTDPAIYMHTKTSCVVANNVIKGTGTNAIQLTTVTNTYLAHNITDGYTNLYTAATSTIIEDSGGIANGVQINGVPTAGQVPIASTATLAAWGSPSTYSQSDVLTTGWMEPTVDDGTDTLIFDSHRVVMDWATS